MRDRPGIVIVGAGHGGFNAAAALRQEGFDGHITLVDRQTGLPYQRPPLSKGLLKTRESTDALAFRPESFYAENRIDLRDGVSVTEIDRQGRSVGLSDGGILAYDHLILAMGAKTRALPVAGASLDGVHELRIAADAERFRMAIAAAQTLVVVGAGFIGLEIAATAAALGIAVTVVELADRVLGRSATPHLADFVANVHRDNGIRLVLGAGVAEIGGAGGRATGVVLENGERIPADLVLVGIGVVADGDLAVRAALGTEDGILVDEMLLTDDPAISAIGDVARFRHAESGQSFRLESVQNAVDQAKCVAARLTGHPRPYDKSPWFWSDQGNLRLQIAGLSGDADAFVPLGDPDTGKFSVLCFRGDRLVAVESVNRPADHIAARQILETNRPLSLEDSKKADFSLRDYAKSLRAVT